MPKPTASQRQAQTPTQRMTYATWGSSLTDRRSSIAARWTDPPPGPIRQVQGPCWPCEQHALPPSRDGLIFLLPPANRQFDKGHEQASEPGPVRQPAAVPSRRGHRGLGVGDQPRDPACKPATCSAATSWEPSYGGTRRRPRRRRRGRRLAEAAECRPWRAASASTGGFRHKTSGVGIGALRMASTSTSVRAWSASIFKITSPTRRVAQSPAHKP